MMPRSQEETALQVALLKSAREDLRRVRGGGRKSEPTHTKAKSMLAGIIPVDLAAIAGR